MACALGLGDQLVGITHECDYPPEIEGKPVVVRNVLPIETMSQLEIDAAVTQRMKQAGKIKIYTEVLNGMEEDEPVAAPPPRPQLPIRTK